jgi:hypothetical protein
MPVVLGAGLRLFENIDPGLSLAKIGVQEVGTRTSLLFHVTSHGGHEPENGGRSIAR